LFRVLAYRLQADRLGDLDGESRRLLDGSASPEDAAKRAADPNRLTTDVRPGTMLAREWNGRMHRVAVLSNGFAWNGRTYRLTVRAGRARWDRCQGQAEGRAQPAPWFVSHSFPAPRRWQAARSPGDNPGFEEC